LGSIIKHNVHETKPEDIHHKAGAKKTGPVTVAESSPPPPEDQDAAEEEALREFYRTHQRLAKSDNHGILYDAYARRAVGHNNMPQENKQHHKDHVDTGELSKATFDHKEVAKANDIIARQVNESQLFNLELLKSPALDDSPASALRRTLRKHFFVEDERKLFDNSPPSTPVKHTDRLVEITPPSGETVKVASGRKGTSPNPSRNATVLNDEAMTAAHGNVASGLRVCFPKDLSSYH
jgi:hypothetical protein